MTNVTGEFVEDIHETEELLKQQVSSPVRWEQSIRKLIASGADIFVEIGPGKTLSGFMRKIDKTVKMFRISTMEEMYSVIAAIKEAAEC